MGGGGLGNFGGVSRILLGHIHKILIYRWNPELKLSRLAPLLGDLIKGGGPGCLVIEMHGMSPSRPRGCVQADYQQLIPNLQFTHCIMHRLHD